MPNTSNACVLFSGGKDSNYAFLQAVKQGYKVKCLLTVIPEASDSYMFHKPAIEHTKLQAQALEIPQIIIHSKGEKELELEDLKKGLEKVKKEFHVDTVVSGALASNYQRERIQKLCDKLELKTFNPLWGNNQTQLMQELIKENFKVMVVAVAAHGLNESWLGRILDKQAIQELIELEKKFQINVAAEGGEFETFVFFQPLFKKQLVVKESEKQWDGVRGELIIKRIELEYLR
ncbi:MAG: diphthine--ammonia ligase [archaeon]